MRDKMHVFFDNFEKIILFENSKKLKEFSKEINFNPNEDLSKMEKTLCQIKMENENVTVETFRDLYTLIHQTNQQIR